jgi:membrane protein implicated in regulation of membrane protease activity
LHAVGPEVLAWLDWLVALPRSIAATAAGMDVAWVAVVVSIVAILAAFAIMYFQKGYSDRTQEREQVRRAEVVAFRMSVWLAEVGASIAYAEEVQGLAGQPFERAPFSRYLFDP